MSGFPEKINQKEDKFRQTVEELRSFMRRIDIPLIEQSLKEAEEMIDDVLDCYAQDQKEDQEIQASLAKTCTDLNDKILKLEEAERERKQKLQEWASERTKFYEDAREDYDDGDSTEVNFLGRIQGINEAMKKFEELLDR